MLLTDGTDINSLDPLSLPPVMKRASSSHVAPRFTFPARPFILAVPRTRMLSGSDLYELAWRHATCGAEPSLGEWGFELRAVQWSAEDDGELVPCDEFAYELPRRGALAMDWRVLPEPISRASDPPETHESVGEARAEDEKRVTLPSCLESLAEARTLAEDDAWHCPTCVEPRRVTIQSAFDRLPEVLVLQLKRFYYMAKRRGKISTRVDFPLQDLDLSPWVAPGREVPGPYDLFAAVNHIGGYGGGHYTANARPSSAMRGRDPNTWHHFNDRICKPASEEDLVSRDAYVLLYRKRREAVCPEAPPSSSATDELHTSAATVLVDSPE